MKARDGSSTSTPSEDDMVAVLSSRNGSTRLVPRSDIFYVQSHGDFVRIVTGDGRYLLRATLAELERRWEPFGFVRVHRGFVANLKQAIELRPQLGGTAELVSGRETVPVARRHGRAETALGRVATRKHQVRLPHTLERSSAGWRKRMRA